MMPASTHPTTWWALCSRLAQVEKNLEKEVPRQSVPQCQASNDAS